MPKFHVTYEIVTPESAEHGDAAERGFVTPGGWRHEINSTDINDPGLDLDLRSAVNLIGCVENSGSWFTETDGRDDYRTGANERRSLHPPRNITPASYARLARLLAA